MSRLSSLRRTGPAALKGSWMFGGGGFTQSNFWLSDDRRSLLSGWTDSGGREERVGNSFEQYATQALKRNGVVFTCMAVRQFGLSEARFQFQELNDGRPGDLFDAPALSVLHRPAPNMTTGEMIARMDQSASLAGNAYLTPVGGRLRSLRPDWVKILVGVRGDDAASPFSLDAEVLGYIYHPEVSGTARRPDPVVITPDRMVHYSPIPDPTAQFRGMSWMTPVLPEIDGDSAAMRHKLKFFENGATSNFVLTYDASVSPDSVTRYAEMFKQINEGVDKAYKTLHIGGGVDPKMIGADMKQLDFKVTQGHGETRIAAASGVGAVVAQLSEGLQGSSLNAGNFQSAMRRCGDLTFRPTWRMMAGALETVAAPPESARLWYDDRDIEFLKADRKDAAEIEFLKAQTMRQLVDGGFVPETVVAAVQTENMSLLEHTGKTPVQLHDPNETPSAAVSTDSPS